jgi:hypothetical protein
MDWKEEAEEIWDQYATAKKCCGEKCTKFGGALFTEILRKHLLPHGIPVSTRDVFVRDLNLEVDLLVHTKTAAEPDHGILYNPSDVLGVLEVKAFGAVGGKEAVQVVKRNLETIGQLTGAKCFYVCLQENQEREFDGQQVSFGDYSFFLNKTKPRRRDETGDWKRLITDLESLAQRD